MILSLSEGYRITNHINIYIDGELSPQLRGATTQGRSQTLLDGRAHFLKHTTPIVSYIASYWHAGSYVRLFIGVLKSAKYD